VVLWCETMKMSDFYSHKTKERSNKTPKESEDERC